MRGHRGVRRRQVQRAFPARQSLDYERGRLIARARSHRWRPTPCSSSRQASESARCHNQAYVHVPAPVLQEDRHLGPPRVSENNTGWDSVRTWSGLGQVGAQAPSMISSNTAPDSVRAPAREHPRHVIGCSARRGPSRRAARALPWVESRGIEPRTCWQIADYQSVWVSTVLRARSLSGLLYPSLDRATGTAVARGSTRARERQRSSWPQSQPRPRPYHRIYRHQRGTWRCS